MPTYTLSGRVSGGEAARVLERHAARAPGEEHQPEQVGARSDDGVEGLQFIMASVKSSKQGGGWVKLSDV